MKNYVKVKIKIGDVPEDVFEAVCKIKQYCMSLLKKERKQFDKDIEKEISAAMTVAYYNELKRIAYETVLLHQECFPEFPEEGGELRQA